MWEQISYKAKSGLNLSKNKMLSDTPQDSLLMLALSTHIICCVSGLLFFFWSKIGDKHKQRVNYWCQHQLLATGVGIRPELHNWCIPGAFTSSRWASFVLPLLVAQQKLPHINPVVWSEPFPAVCSMCKLKSSENDWPNYHNNVKNSSVKKALGQILSDFLLFCIKICSACYFLYNLLLWILYSHLKLCLLFKISVQSNQPHPPVLNGLLESVPQTNPTVTSSFYCIWVHWQMRGDKQGHSHSNSNIDLWLNTTRVSS